MKCHKAYKIRRSQRAQRARIVVTADKVEVVAPLCMSEKLIHQFMHTKLDWVESAKKKVQDHLDKRNSLAPESYRQGALIPYRGQQYSLQIKTAQQQQINIRFDQLFIATVPQQQHATFSSSDLSEQIRIALVDWMGKAASKQALEMMNKYALLYQLHPRSIRIKTQKSRWGSCGIHDDINLNWLLILAPDEVFEYVVIHELCHIAQRNHSAAFWTLVERHCPNYKQHRLWLKQHGSSLMLGL